MWGKKKPVAPQTADPEATNLQTNQPTKFPPAFWERTRKIDNATIRPLGRPTGATADGATSRLGSSLHIKGEISGNEDLHVDGEVEGPIRLGEGRLTVGAAAKVTSDIIAREVVVHGKVKGNVHAKDKIEIKKEGSVTGDLTMAQILIEDGAHFKGSIDIERNVEKEADRNVIPPAA
jgi:cytoskeletal protein CcmA (bactofilin family)